MGLGTLQGLKATNVERVSFFVLKGLGLYGLGGAGFGVEGLLNFRFHSEGLRAAGGASLPADSRPKMQKDWNRVLRTCLSWCRLGGTEIAVIPSSKFADHTSRTTSGASLFVCLSLSLSFSLSLSCSLSLSLLSLSLSLACFRSLLSVPVDW